jgi:hypothetical protein
MHGRDSVRAGLGFVLELLVVAQVHDRADSVRLQRRPPCRCEVVEAVRADYGTPARPTAFDGG